MPALQSRVRSGVECHGGIAGYPLETLHEEVAFVAFHFHWQRSEILELEHMERRRWVAEISAINERINEGTGS